MICNKIFLQESRHANLKFFFNNCEGNTTFVGEDVGAQKVPLTKIQAHKSEHEIMFIINLLRK